MNTKSETADSKMIVSIATSCATAHRKQGWQGDGAAYDVGVYYGDQEAFEHALGRKATRDELIEFESAIRAELSR